VAVGQPTGQPLFLCSALHKCHVTATACSTALARCRTVRAARARASRALPSLSAIRSSTMPFSSSFLPHASTATAIGAAPTSHQWQPNSVAPRPPPSSPSGACSHPNASRVHRVHQVCGGCMDLKFSPPPIPCSTTVPLSVITAAGHPSPPSTVPKSSSFSCDAAGIMEASRRPPELPTTGIPQWVPGVPTPWNWVTTTPSRCPWFIASDTGTAGPPHRPPSWTWP
jgi:hypothetical protein